VLHQQTDLSFESKYRTTGQGFLWRKRHAFVMLISFSLMSCSGSKIDGKQPPPKISRDIGATSELSPEDLTNLANTIVEERGGERIYEVHLGRLYHEMNESDLHWRGTMVCGWLIGYVKNNQQWEKVNFFARKPDKDFPLHGGWFWLVDQPGNAGGSILCRDSR
jgi:hypothetical protein